MIRIDILSQDPDQAAMSVCGWVQLECTKTKTPKEYVHSSGVF